MDFRVILFITGLLLGAVTTALMVVFSRRRELRWAKKEAQELVESAQKDAEAAKEELTIHLEEMREDALELFAKETRKVVQKSDELEDQLDTREAEFTNQISARETQVNRQFQMLSNRQKKIALIESRNHQLKDRCQNLKQRFLVEAKSKIQIPIEDLKTKIQSQFEQEVKTSSTRHAQEIEQSAQVNAERDAKKVLYQVLNRFSRPYCAERGIGNINFENEEHKNHTFGEKRMWVQKIEQLCGVDIVYNENYQSATVMGFDPVRRELGRLVLEKAAQQRQLNEKILEDLHQRSKKDLFKKILSDGNRVASELRLTNLQEGVRNMLGALRYRYSFAQNQHFHVAEVGWLGGLLSAELGISSEDGRRAGLLHDIGKAMDHSRDGGHAVIGAEFIAQHGEKAEIVHAVRAHHYDEAPSTDLAFITIAADAMSGARPELDVPPWIRTRKKWLILKKLVQALTELLRLTF